MRYVVSSTLLYSRLQNVERVILSKNSIAILSCFLFDIKENLLEVTASDSETVMKTSLELVESSQDCKFAIDAKKLMDILKEIPEQPLTLDFNPNTLQLDMNYQNGHFTVQAESGDEFPLPRPAEGESQEVKLDIATFSKGLAKTIIATANNEARKVMNGVHFDITPDDVSLVVPKDGMLFDARVRLAQRASRRYSHEVAFARQSVPLAEHAQLRMRLRKEVPDKTKIYVAARQLNARNPLDFDKETYVAATADDQWVTCEPHDIGMAFVAAYDDSPPRISPVRQQAWEELQTVCVDVRDEASGVAGVEGSVDGQFVLFEYVKRSSQMVCNLTKTPLTPNGGERLLSVRASDRCGNTSVFETKIIY